jgi:hypothetical protein
MTIVQIRSLAPIRKLDAKADEFRRDLFAGRIASKPIEVKGRSMRQRPSRFSGKTANAQDDAELDSVGKRGRVGDRQRDLIVPREKDAKRNSHAQDVARWPEPIRLSMLGRKRLRLRRLEERHLERIVAPGTTRPPPLTTEGEANDLCACVRECPPERG